MAVRIHRCDTYNKGTGLSSLKHSKYVCPEEQLSSQCKTYFSLRLSLALEWAVQANNGVPIPGSI